jgi:hypothetical protein
LKKRPTGRLGVDKGVDTGITALKRSGVKGSLRYKTIAVLSREFPASSRNRPGAIVTKLLVVVWTAPDRSTCRTVNDSGLPDVVGTPEYPEGPAKTTELPSVERKLARGDVNPAICVVYEALVFVPVYEKGSYRYSRMLLDAFNNEKGMDITTYLDFTRMVLTTFGLGFGSSGRVDSGTVAVICSNCFSASSIGRSR